MAPHSADPAHSQVMGLLSQIWKLHKRQVRETGKEVPTSEINIDALALDFITNLSLKDAVM